MPVNHDKKLLFVHIPKCAGTTIEEAFNMPNKESIQYTDNKEPGNLVSTTHLKASELIKKLGDTTDYYKFTIVRNPFDRLVSAFYQIQRNIYVPQKVKTMKFGKFVRYIETIDPIERCYVFDGHLETQSSFIDLGDVTIFKYESIQECFDFLNNNYGPVTFGHALKSTNRGNYNLYFDDVTQQIVQNMYAVDFERFDYSTQP